MNIQTPPSPDSERWVALRSVDQPLAIDDVAGVVAEASNGRRHLYVERRAGRYAWSIAHRGGPYPLLRDVAAYVRLPHDALVVAGRAVGDWCVLIGPDNEDDPPAPDAWAVITPPGNLGEEEARSMIRRALDAADGARGDGATR